MKQQTAVEWLMPNVLGLTIQLSNNRISQRTCELKILELFEQAKEMEKEQMFGFTNEYHVIGEGTEKFFKEEFEKYYNENYGK